MKNCCSTSSDSSVLSCGFEHIQPAHSPEKANIPSISSNFFPRTIFNTRSTALQFESMRQQLQVLDAENRRIMANHGRLIADTNRRIEIHKNEARSLRDEIDELRKCNDMLRRWAQDVENERQKSQRLSLEWQKFGQYTNFVMKQEVRAYQERLREVEERQRLLQKENDELKRLCLYLDEQRQNALLMRRTIDLPSSSNTVSKDGENSFINYDSSGCGSCTGSQKGSEEDVGEHLKIDIYQSMAFDRSQEKALELITEQMRKSLAVRNDKECRSLPNASCNTELLQYVKSLENRIKQLEASQSNQSDSDPNDLITVRSDSWSVASLEDHNVDECSDDLKTLQASEQIENASGNRKIMSTSATSIMTSSGTTFCSTDTDDSAATAVLVMGTDMDRSFNDIQESRTLGPIDEEIESDSPIGGFTTENTSKINESFDQCDFPPQIPPISLSVSRLTKCNTTSPADSNDESFSLLSTVLPSDSYLSDVSNRATSSNSGDIANLKRYKINRGSLCEAVKVLRVHELASNDKQCNLSSDETALVQRICQVAWDSLDHNSQSTLESNPLHEEMTVV